MEARVMGMDSFAMVFAPSMSEVREQRDKHRRSELAWLIIALALAVSVIVCLRLFLGDPREPAANEMIARITFTGTLIEMCALVGAVCAMFYHGSKAEHFEQKLNNEYISFH